MTSPTSSPPLREAPSPDARVYRVGLRYLVPCIRCTLQTWPSVVPVMGPLHDDKEIIRFNERHWHVDWRFFPSQWWERWTRSDDTDLARSIFGRVLCEKNAAGSVFAKRLKCKRDLPEYGVTYPARNWIGAPHVEEREVPWLHELETAYAGRRLTTCMKCPHRGLPLDSLPAVNGVVVCPGHGLAWNATTGDLVRRVAREADAHA